MTTTPSTAPFKEGDIVQKPSPQPIFEVLGMTDTGMVRCRDKFGYEAKFWPSELAPYSPAQSSGTDVGKAVAEPSITTIRNRLDSYLNAYLCDMKEGYDDSVVGFNEAWDVMRKVFDAATKDNPNG